MNIYVLLGVVRVKFWVIANNILKKAAMGRVYFSTASDVLIFCHNVLHKLINMHKVFDIRKIQPSP